MNKEMKLIFVFIEFLFSLTFHATRIYGRNCLLNSAGYPVANYSDSILTFERLRMRLVPYIKENLDRGPVEDYPARG